MRRGLWRRRWVLKILTALFVLCATQADGYAWFHSSDNFDIYPVFERHRNAEHVSRTYAFLPNLPETDSDVRLYGTCSKNSLPVSAGKLKIDIPFNLLSASTTNIQALLDRQVAANLRLKNLIEQYRAQQKKNAEMLKDLKIPYLEAKNTRKKTKPSSDTPNLPPTNELRQTIADEILFQAKGKDSTALLDSRNFQSIPTGKKTSGNSMSDLEKFERMILNDNYSKDKGGSRTYHEAYGRDTELPWIFSFGLKIVRLLANNKIEIFSWAAAMAVIGLVGTIVAKR